MWFDVLAGLAIGVGYLARSRGWVPGLAAIAVVTAAGPVIIALFARTYRWFGTLGF